MSETNYTKSCPKCGARWFYENESWQHYWSTGKKGNEIDLNSLVCVPYGDDTCINPCKNSEIEGDTWDKRLNDLSKKLLE
jgi:hypothetical protein